MQLALGSLHMLAITQISN